MKIWNVLLLIFSFNHVFAQSTLGARLTAMGNHGAAITDVWATQANPAGICGFKTPFVSLNYTKHLIAEDVSTQGFVAILPIKGNNIAVTVVRYGFSSYHDNKVSLTYGKQFGKEISFALNVNYHQLLIPNYGSSTAFSVDVGILYQLNANILLGAFVTNPSNQTFNNVTIETKIPTSVNIGASYTVSDKVLIASTISKEFGKSTDVSLGIDYKLIDMLCVRGGLSTKPFKQYMGFGLNYRKFSFDMATMFDPNLGYAPQLTIGYAF